MLQVKVYVPYTSQLAEMSLSEAPEDSDTCV